jgi:hypothetical protein
VIVIFCAANQQNLEGAYKMASDFKRPALQALRGGRALDVLVIPARIEAAEGGKLNRFKQDFLSRADAFAPAALNKYPEMLWTLGIPYVPYYAYNEAIAVRERDEAIADALVKAFERLTRTLTWLAPNGSPLKRAFSAGPVDAPGARDALAIFHSNFQAAYAQIQVLYDYKRLHDRFQDLDDLAGLIQQDLRRLPGDGAAWQSLGLYNAEFQDIVGSLLAIVRQASFAGEEARRMEQLSQQLGQSGAEMQAAIGNADGGQLRAVMARLNRVLIREPSRINSRLVAVANTLRLDTLVGTMTAVQRRLERPGVGRESVQQFEEGIAALAKLNERLAPLVANHDDWQALDDELRRVAANLELDLDELAVSWPDLKRMAQELCGDNPADWAQALRTSGDELESALGAENRNQARRLFWRFRGQTSRRFRQVDGELLALCRDLQKVGEPLDLLPEMIL